MKEAIICFIMSIGLALLLYLNGSCASWQDNTAKTLDALQVAVKTGHDIARPKLHKQCVAIAVKCKEQKISDCAAWIECDKTRAKIYAAFKLVLKAIPALAEVMPELGVLIDD
jgi:hypothetical protein